MNPQAQPPPVQVRRAHTRLGRMAWRNLWRNRRRTGLTLVGIAFAVLLAVVSIGMGDSSYGKMIDLAARTGAGNVTIQHRDFQDLPSLKRSLQNATKFVTLAKGVEGVNRVQLRIGGAAMIATARKSYGAAYVAVDPTTEDSSSLSILDSITSGEMFAKSDGDGVVLGAELAENLKVRLGQKVVYTLSDKHGEIVSGMGRVRGLIRTGSPSVDRLLFLVPLDTMRELVGYGQDEAGQAAVFVDEQRHSRRVADDLKAVLASGSPDETARVLSWDEVMPDLASFIAIDQAGNYVFQLIIILLVAAGIFNTIFVSVMERMRQFGIMMAIGFRPVQVYLLVVWETVWVGLLGLVAGAFLTAWPYHYLHTVGIDFSEEFGENYEVSGVAVDLVMKADIVPIKLVYIAALVFAMTVLSGLYPAWRASRVVPVNAIKLV